MVTVECFICGDASEVFLSEDDIPKRAHYYPCSKCAKSDILLVSEHTKNYAWVAPEVFKALFNGIPEDGVAIVSGTVYNKFLVFLLKSGKKK